MLPLAPCLSLGTPPVSSELSAGAVAGVSIGVVVLLAVLVFLIGGVVILYIGYRRPTSKLGLFLIEVSFFLFDVLHTYMYVHVYTCIAECDYYIAIIISSHKQHGLSSCSIDPRLVL